MLLEGLTHDVLVRVGATVRIQSNRLRSSKIFAALDVIWSIVTFLLCYSRNVTACVINCHISALAASRNAYNVIIINTFAYL